MLPAPTAEFGKGDILTKKEIKKLSKKEKKQYKKDLAAYLDKSGKSGKSDSQ